MIVSKNSAPATPKFTPAKYEIHLCSDRNVPVCGNLVGKPEHLILKRERYTDWKEEATLQQIDSETFEGNLEDGTKRIIAEAKLYRPLLGPKFNQRWYAWNVKHFVYDPLPKSAWPFLRSSKTSFNKHRVDSALKVRGELLQAERDGLQNLMPLIILFERNPKDLKKLLGHSVWRKLAANTKTRNYLICLLAMNDAGHHKNGEIGIDNKVRFLADIETSVIQYFIRRDNYREFDESEITAARHSMTFSEQNIESRLQLHRETTELLKAGNRQCPPSWSNKRLRQEHDTAVNNQIVRGLTWGDDTSFAAPFIHQGHVSGNFAFRLRCERELVEEAIAQRHCVSVYLDDARAGTYAVFKIFGVERATLGVSISGKTKGKFACKLDQVTLAFNRAASDATIEFCRELIPKFAKHLNEKTNTKSETYIHGA